MLWCALAPWQSTLLQGGAGCCRVVQGVAGCCRVLQGVAGCCSELYFFAEDLIFELCCIHTGAMSHFHISHVTHSNDLSPFSTLLHIRMSCVTHSHESCHTIISLPFQLFHMFSRVMSRIYMRHVTHSHASCHTLTWVMSHIHTTRLSVLSTLLHFHTCQVMSHVYMSYVTHIHITDLSAPLHICMRYVTASHESCLTSTVHHLTACVPWLSALSSHVTHSHTFKRVTSHIHTRWKRVMLHMHTHSNESCHKFTHIQTSHVTHAFKRVTSPIPTHWKRVTSHIHTHSHAFKRVTSRTHTYWKLVTSHTHSNV